MPIWWFIVALTVAANALGYPEHTTTLTNEVQGYRFEYPLDWRVDIRAEDGSAAELTLADVAAMAVFVDPVTPEQAGFVASMSIDDWLELLQEQAHDSLDGAVVLQAAERSVSGRPAAVLRFSGVDRIDDTKMMAAFALLPTAEALYFLAFRADIAQAAELEGVLELALSSFTLLGPEFTRYWHEDAASGLRLAYPTSWRLDESPGLERSLLKGTRETVERDGVAIETVSYPSVDSIALYRDDAAVFLHSYRRQDVPATHVSELAALMRAELQRELIDVRAESEEATTIAGRPAVAIAYAGLDRHLGARVSGTAYLFESASSWHSLTLEAPEAEHDEHRAELESIWLSVEPALTNLVRPSFAGDYRAGDLTLGLRGANGEYSGTMTLGDRAFPITATSDGTRLEGTFVVEDGTSFSFSAVLSGTGLTLESEGSRHELERR